MRSREIAETRLELLAKQAGDVHGVVFGRGPDFARAGCGGESMATSVGRLTIWSIVALIGIVIVALILVNRM
jgi:hypothetical protein